MLEDFEVVSTCGTHLGHQMTDPDGAPRFCINLCSVAGNPRADGATADDAGIDRALKLREAWPVLHEIADAGCWRGAMHYATGPDALSVAPFVLEAQPVSSSRLWARRKMVAATARARTMMGMLRT